MLIRHASLDEIIPVRHQVLRQGLPQEACHFSKDRLPSATHWAAFADNPDRAVACLSLYAEPFPGSLPETAVKPPADTHWRLRGMAVLPAYQGNGLGRQLLQSAIKHLTSASPTLLIWCNARDNALGFYQKLGFQVCGQGFQIPGIGPHHRMWYTAPSEIR